MQHQKSLFDRFSQKSSFYLYKTQPIYYDEIHLKIDSLLKMLPNSERVASYLDDFLSEINDLNHSMSFKINDLISWNRILGLEGTEQILVLFEAVRRNHVIGKQEYCSPAKSALALAQNRLLARKLDFNQHDLTVLVYKWLLQGIPTGRGAKKGNLIAAVSRDIQLSGLSIDMREALAILGERLKIGQYPIGLMPELVRSIRRRPNLPPRKLSAHARSLIFQLDQLLT